MQKQPETLGEILESLTPGIPLLVPDELLGIWFPPGVVNGDLHHSSEAAASAAAVYWKCEFEYIPEERAGRFSKHEKPN